MASSANDNVNVVLELSAPPGWAKKSVPKKGGTSEIIFTAPTGEEIKNKKHLEEYLKSHPGSPTMSQFSWTAVDTPTRRSTRITHKVKTAPPPQTASPLKRTRKSSADKKEAIPTEAKEVEMKDDHTEKKDTLTETAKAETQVPSGVPAVEEKEIIKNGVAEHASTKEEEEDSNVDEVGKNASVEVKP